MDKRGVDCMTEIRCVKCRRLLMKATRFDGEIKCPKCGYVNNIIIPENIAQFIISTDKDLKDGEWYIRP